MRRSIASILLPFAFAACGGELDPGLEPGFDPELDPELEIGEEEQTSDPVTVSGPTAVSSFTLIDIGRNAPVPGFEAIRANVTIDRGALPAQVGIRANTSPSLVGSVRFGWAGNPSFQTENYSPYSLTGDSSGRLNPVTLSAGVHRLTATPYTQPLAAGTAGTALSVELTVLDSTPGVGLPPRICTPPVEPFDTSVPTTVVGNGTAASCTESAFAQALAAGGVITFNCGASPATIRITSEKALKTDRDTIIDGGGKVTLDGGGTTRIFRYYHGNYRVWTKKVVLQNLTLINGKASGTAIAPASPPLSQGSMLDGGGGAIWMRDGHLYVINSVFRNNQCARLGPDVGGGAIYVIGSSNVTVVGSRFEGNSGSNGGAIGILQTTMTLANNVFAGNHAVGHGGNGVNSSGQQIGSGGLGGAIYIDGSDNGTVSICGTSFTGNDSISLGGAFFRVAERVSPMVIDRCTFDRNKNLVPPSGETTGAGAAYIQGCTTTFVGSTVSRNTSPSSGAGLRFESCSITMRNVTIAENAAGGLGGGIFLGGGNSGRIQNVTFANNRITGGSGKFSAAIAAPGSQPVTIANTVFSNNTTTDPNVPMTCAFRAFPDGGGNIQWPRTRSNGALDNACTANVLWADPQLGALGAHGGPTETMVTGSASPARGRGDGCPSTDQRGRARPANGCTVGSVEGS